MDSENEKQLLFVIKYSLIIFIISLSIVITTFLYFGNKTAFEKIKKNTEEKYISDKKKIIKEQVDNAYDYIISEQKETENNLKESLYLRVYETHKIITNIYNQYKDTNTKEELKLLIKTVIKDIRFNNNRGYFFIYDKTAINIIHPLVSSFEGKSLINYQDSKGIYTLQETLELLKNNDESFYEWYWQKSKTDMNDYRKIGFVKNIYELDWFIGTGEYVDDFSKDIQKKVLSQIDKFRFGDNSYIFTISENNTYLASIRKDVLGKNVFEINNLKDTELVLNKMWQESKNGGGFIEYVQKINPITKEPTSKIAYVKFIPQWNWLIGVGFYKNEVQVLIDREKEILTKEYEDNLKRLFIFSSISTLILLGLSFYISFIIEMKFRKYKNSIKEYIIENQKQYELLAQRSKLAAMGEMIENIAHQWRQPLSLITTASSGIKIQKEMDVLTDDILIEAVTNIGNSANYLSETIDDFRDFFKPDKEKTNFELQSSLDRSFKLLSSQIKNKDIHVIQNIKTVNIKGFERELLQVLLNILKNALDVLETKEGEKYIFIDIYDENNMAIIKIKDNAGGIKEDIIERIFEPYFTTKHKSIGTGIGLYMSEEIITRHMYGELLVENITYEFENKTFTGAMFTIKLPLE